MELAQDAVQQVFLKLWENKTDFREISNPKSYLLSSVKNQVLNYQRKQDVLQHLEHEDVESSYNIDEQLVGKELKVQLELLINTLPPKRQYIFRLSREEDKSYKEIAALMDIAPKTVENQIGKALKYLKNKIYDAEN
ncbi:MAG: RNA polymerase sigma-70 factor (ECF subfamily) [bacterium]|jgi:RNA polymerase sigma-70 factor (ECF subfamily)